MRHFIQLCLLATAALVFAGCSTPGRSSFETVIINPNGNVRLYVSNQSFAISPVDIKVLIDGKRVVNGSFEVGNQHTIEEFVLKLSPGRHKIVAKSSKGHAKLEQEFEINDKAWLALAYWFDSEVKEGHFVFDVKDKQIYFM
jgi:hypothetical protein